MSNRSVENYLYKGSEKGLRKIEPYDKTPIIEKKYFDVLNQKMVEKSNKRIDELQKRLLSDISKNNFNKKYQVKSMFEYYTLKKFVENNESINTKGYEFLWCHGDKLMNKLDKIICGNYFCCRDCDNPMIFVNKKVYVLFCYFYKKSN